MKCVRCDVCRRQLYRHDRVVQIGFEYQFNVDHVLTVHAGECEAIALDVIVQSLSDSAVDRERAIRQRAI